VSAEPQISSVSGTVAHRQNITISGNGFGTKSPAAPLWWDDGEGAPVNNMSVMRSGEMGWVVSGSLAGTSRHYSDVWPYAVTENNGYSNMMYRSAGHRNVAGPHSLSSKFMVGCHDDQGECLGGEVGQNVGVTVGDMSRHDEWYVSFYLRLDPLWPIGTSSNYKFFNWEMGSPRARMYSTPFCYDNVNGCGGCNGYRKAPDCNEEYWGSPHVIQILDRENCPTMTSPYCGSPVITQDTRKRNPRRQWIKEEHVLDGVAERYIIRVNNADLLDTANSNGCGFNRSRYPQNPSGATLGGFWKQGVCGNTQDDLNDNACRFFDDVYVDTTLARVILGNAAEYSSCTILEPQIPSTWSANSITVMVNQGAISSSQAYLYVFDVNNTHNNRGFPVTIGGSSSPPPGESPDNPPSPPTGLKIITD
jgi:hypothetical protein